MDIIKLELNLRWYVRLLLICGRPGMVVVLWLIDMGLPAEGIFYFTTEA